MQKRADNDHMPAEVHSNCCDTRSTASLPKWDRPLRGLSAPPSCLPPADNQSEEGDHPWNSAPFSCWLKNRRCVPNPTGAPPGTESAPRAAHRRVAVEVAKREGERRGFSCHLISAVTGEGVRALLDEIGARLSELPRPSAGVDAS